MTFEDRIAVLQQSLDDNTAAVLRLAELIDFAASATKLASQAEVEQNTASSPPETGVPHTPSPREEAAVSTPEVSSSSPPAAAVVTYDQAKDAILKLATIKGRDAAIAILEPHGIKNVKAADPSLFPAILAACEAALV